MTIFQFALNAHILAGTVVLAAFWTAALAARAAPCTGAAGASTCSRWSRCSR